MPGTMDLQTLQEARRQLIMATPGVGEDIEDLCTRCGDTWHVVMAKVGDRVKVMETRPLSKLKRWRLVEILERAK